MIDLIVTIDVRIECVEDFLTLVRDHVRESRRERGCLRFEVLRSNIFITGTATEFIFHEVWSDYPALENHRKTKHYLKWREDVPSMEVKPHQHMTFDRVLIW